MVCLGTGVGWLARKGENLLDRLNDRLVHLGEKLVSEGKHWALEAITILSLVLIFLFSFLFLGGAIWSGLVLTRLILSWAGEIIVRGFVFGEKLLPLLGLAVIFKLFFSRKNMMLAASGLAAALIWGLFW
ncbi:membrane protein [sediment metagenome]|uniref:Membrane protein n=1 Tax=sediment metagenome TaxID=749907 RepID=D9PHP7_9ZZZZ